MLILFTLWLNLPNKHTARRISSIIFWLDCDGTCLDCITTKTKINYKGSIDRPKKNTCNALILIAPSKAPARKGRPSPFKNGLQLKRYWEWCKVNILPDLQEEGLLQLPFLEQLWAWIERCRYPPRNDHFLLSTLQTGQSRSPNREQKQAGLKK